MKNAVSVKNDLMEIVFKMTERVTEEIEDSVKYSFGIEGWFHAFLVSPEFEKLTPSQKVKALTTYQGILNFIDKLSDLNIDEKMYAADVLVE